MDLHEKQGPRYIYGIYIFMHAPNGWTHLLALQQAGGDFYFF